MFFVTFPYYYVHVKKWFFFNNRYHLLVKVGPEEVNMKRLRYQSLLAVWIVIICILMSSHVYRNFIADMQIGFLLSESVYWLHLMVLMLLFNLPDAISVFLYLMLVYKTPDDNQEEEEEGSIGIDNEYVHAHGIYVGGEARHSANPVDADPSQMALNIESGVFQELPGLPGSCNDQQDARSAKSTPDKKVTSSPSHLALSEVKAGSLPSTIMRVEMPESEAAVNQQHQMPHPLEHGEQGQQLPQVQHHNAIKECGIRALKAHLVISYLVFLVFPIMVFFLPQGTAKMVPLTFLMVFATFWIPTVMVLYNVEKLRMISRSALEWIITRARLLLL